MKFCQQCGREIAEEKFCPGCGSEIPQEVSEEVTTQRPENPVESNVVLQAPKSKNFLELLQSNMKVLPFIGIGVVVVIVVAVLFLGKGPNFKKLYKEYGNPVWADVASDGSYLSIDTNPYDEEDNGAAYYAAYTAIKNINKELGIPDSLLEEMEQTTSSDGKQSEEFKNITVSWKYHPDKGLEVTYKK